MSILNFKSLVSLFVFLFLFSPLNIHAGESDTYSFTWLDPDKEVYVLQNRKYRKKGKVHLNLGGGKTLSGAFVDGTTLQGRIGYFFGEEWGFEGVYAKNSGSENVTAESVRNRGASGSIPFRRIVDKYMGGMILWSPFYSKINTFNKIIYFDWIFGLGYGSMQETNNTDEFIGAGNDDTTITHNGILWDVGMKFFINESFNLRLDMTVFHYKADIVETVNGATNTLNRDAGQEWYSNWDLAASIGVNF
jgi:outer membrane beta-barrel protein